MYRTLIKLYFDQLILSAFRRYYQFSGPLNWRTDPADVYVSFVSVCKVYITAEIFDIDIYAY